MGRVQKALTEAAMKSIAAKDMAPKFGMAAKWTEDAPCHRHQNDILLNVGMPPCQSAWQRFCCRHWEPIYFPKTMPIALMRKFPRRRMRISRRQLEAIIGPGAVGRRFPVKVPRSKPSERLQHPKQILN
uniref:Uncharacterized protein n=1 Tax=Panagrellus redivivus TaxID=6233 RepID=A0A7E4ZVF5_PANRE